jgi:purine catabolism regulator
MRTRPPAFESLQGGEAALISLSALSALQAVDRSLTLLRVLDSLAEARVAAVVVGGVEGEVLPDEVQRAALLADERGLPLIALPRKPLLPDVERAIITAVVHQRGELDARAAAIYQELLGLSLRRAGIQAMVERLMLARRKPVALEDENGRVLHLASPGHAAWAARAGLEQSIQALSFQPGGARSGSGASLVQLQELRVPGVSRLVVPLRGGAEVVGYCSLIDETQRLDALDRLVVEQAAPLLALELGRVRELAAVEQRLHGDVLDEVLEGRAGDLGQALLRARQLGYDLERPVVVVLAALPGNAGSGAAQADQAAVGRGEQAALDVAARCARQLIAEVERRFPGALVRRRPAEVVVLLPLGEARADDEPKAGGLPQRWRERLKDLLSHLDPHYFAMGLCLGVSRPAIEARQLGLRLREARQALTIGRRVGYQPPLTFFGDLGIARLLFHLPDVAEVRAFYEETLGPLLAYDLRTASELVPTLEMYFDCHGNLSQAAQKLHLHRNSLLYRLERIEEVVGVDLEDAEARLSLQVALHLRYLFPV